MLFPTLITHERPPQIHFPFVRQSELLARRWIPRAIFPTKYESPLCVLYTTVFFRTLFPGQGGDFIVIFGAICARHYAEGRASEGWGSVTSRHFILAPKFRRGSEFALWNIPWKRTAAAMFPSSLLYVRYGTAAKPTPKMHAEPRNFAGTRRIIFNVSIKLCRSLIARTSRCVRLSKNVVECIGITYT